jgi:nucleoid-associated protein YgaU
LCINERHTKHRSGKRWHQSTTPQEATMGLREKYDYAIQTAKSLRFQGSAEEQAGKLHFKGTVNSQDEANKIWDAIKTIPDWQKDVQADIKVNPPAPQPVGTSRSAGRTYTVKPGDTLSKIAKDELGNANAYMDIFNANRDTLSDPDKIMPGQTLKIPEMAKH